nr:peptidase [Brevundimonas subvibrioides]
MKTAFGLALMIGALVLTTGASVAAPLSGQKGQKGQRVTAPAVDISQRATYGDASLRSGFTPDPYRIDMYSGGDVDASAIANGCVGMVARAPDFQLTYSAGSLPLIFGVTSSNDTTLVINGPDGRWYCDDDSGEGTNPLMSISDPQSGTYDVFVGAYGGNGAAAQLYITELNSQVYGDSDGNDDDRYSDASRPNSGLTANFGEYYLSAGFTPDPYWLPLYSGGSIDASVVASGCVGMISEAPDFQLTYESGSLPLTFGVEADGDTTLVINGPDGQWYCDDDSGGQADPEVTFRNPRSGVYDVWVGAYAGRGVSGRLFVTELGR